MSKQDMKNRVELKSPSKLISDNTEYFQTLMTSKLARIFQTFRDFLLTSASRKKKLRVIHEHWQTEMASSLMRRTYQAWRIKSEPRMKMYKGLEQLSCSVEGALQTSRKGMLQLMFSEVKSWSKQLAKYHSLTKKLEKVRRRRNLAKSFMSLSNNAKRCVSWKRATKMIERILKARNLKQEVIGVLQGISRRIAIYQVSSAQLAATLKKRSRRIAWDAIVELNENFKRKSDAAEKYLNKTKEALKKKSLAIWKALVKRKSRATMKGKELAELNGLRLASKCIKNWADRVLKDKFSLYCRSKTLERCLTQVRVIKAIDHMVQVTQASKERKREIVAWLCSINNLIVGKVVKRFIENAQKTADFKDNIEYCVEKIQRIFVRLTVYELAEETRKSKLADSIVEEFKKRSARRAFLAG